MHLVRNPRALRVLLFAAGSVVAVWGPLRPSVGADLGEAAGLVMVQSVPGTGTTCSSAANGTGTATCSTVNLYGGSSGPLVPGGAAHTNEVTITNAGTRSAHGFALVAGPCDSARAPGAHFSGNGDLCEELRVRITAENYTVLFDGTAAMLENATIDLLDVVGQRGPVTAGAHRLYTVEVWLEATAARAAYQGLEVTQSLSWRFSA